METLSKLLLILIILASSEYVKSERISRDELESKVDEYVNAGLACHKNPGLSISVVRDNEVLLAKGYGYTRTEKKNPIKNTTLFGVGTLTMSFSATLLLNQLNKHNLSIETTVRSILGDDIFYKMLWSMHTTLEDLLAHRLGFPKSNNKIRLDDQVNRSSLVSRLKYLRPVEDFRTSFHCSKLMYGLITYISEVIGKDKWENLVQSQLFDPLGMKSSSFMTTADPDMIDLAQGYEDVNGTLHEVPFEFSRRWGELCGSECVLSNGVDMAIWMMFHMNGGRNQENVTVVDSDSLDQAQKAHNSIPAAYPIKYYTRPLTPVTHSISNYGLGWLLGHYRGYPILTHPGQTYAYKAMVTMIPALNIGIFTALTGDDPGLLFRTNLHLFILDLLLGESPWLNTTTVCTFPEPWRQKDEPKDKKEPRKDIPPQRDFTSYTGGYKNDGYGIIKVYLSNVSNTIMAHYGFSSFNLYPKINKDEFYAEGSGIVKNIIDFSIFRFVPDKTGTGIVSLSVPGFETKHPPMFTRIKGSGKPSIGSGTNDRHSLFSGLRLYVCVLSFIIYNIV